MSQRLFGLLAALAGWVSCGLSCFAHEGGRVLFPREASAAPATLGGCLGDFNRDGIQNSQDFFDFFACFFDPLCVAADFNHDGSVNSQDYFDFSVAFFTPCESQPVFRVIPPTTPNPTNVILTAFAEMAAEHPGVRATVILLEGEYGLERELQLPDNSSLIGTGSVRLWPRNRPGGFRILCLPGSNCFVQGVTFSVRPLVNPPTTPSPCHLFGVKARTLTNVTIRDCEFIDSGGPDYSATKFQVSNVSYVRFEKCRFELGGLNNVSIYESNAEHIRFIDCDFNESGSWSVDLEPAYTKALGCPHIRDVIFANCFFNASQRDGIASISLDSAGVTFRSCHMLTSQSQSNIAVETDTHNACGGATGVLVRECYLSNVVPCIRTLHGGGCTSVPDGVHLTVTNSCGP